MGTAVRRITRLLALAFACVLTPAVLHAGSVTLNWNPNPEADVVGYVVLYGTDSGAYAFTQQVGNVTTATVTGLKAGKTYYFAIRAVNSDGLSSPVSDEVSTVVPTTSPTGETLDHWKARFAITDMDADPDGDGVSNMDEFLDGTDPFIPNTWLLAEGVTGTFRTRLALTNPGTDPAEITVRFLPQSGTPVVQQYTIPAQSRKTVVVNDIAGLLDVATGAEVTTQRGGVLVERTVTWGGPEMLDSAHTGKAVESAQTTWYFAEGDTTVFDSYLLLVNPNSNDVNATVTFLLASGQTQQVAYTLPADGRQSIYLNAVPGLGQTSFGMIVRATAPIAADRTMYFSTKDTAWKGGHESPGVDAPSTKWYLAEGQTGSTFAEYLLLANPNASAAAATVQYMTSTGTSVTRTYQLPPTTRLTVVVNDVPGLENTEVAAAITSTLPIVVERSMYWPGRWGQWYEGHNSAGMPSLGTKWVLSEGETGGAHNVVSRFLLANPNSQDAAVTLTFMRDNGLSPVSVQATVKGNSRLTLDSTEFPLQWGEQFGTVVESTNGVPFAVERSIYWDGEGKTWIAGTNETGALIRGAAPLADAPRAKAAPAGPRQKAGSKNQSK
jgi:BarA-like signal transduction histidine kinase